MRHRHLLIYGIVAAMLVIGVAAFGASPSTLFAAGFLVLCPLMMIFMMAGMHGGGLGHGEHDSGGSPNEHLDRSASRSGGDSR